MIDLVLVVARFLHYATSTTLAGVAFFPFYVYAGTEPERFAGWRNMLMLWSVVPALISGLAWFVFAVANMSGALADVADPKILASVIRDTGFGVVWTVRMIVAATLVAVALLQVSSKGSAGRDLLSWFLAAGLLASLAGAGHTQIEEGLTGVVHVSADAAHLLAAGAWLGGLVPFGFILLRYAETKAGPDAVDVDGVLMRFSGMGYAAVATLVGTGVVNCWLLVGAVSSLFYSIYGQILMAKLAFFAGMFALAVANRF